MNNLVQKAMEQLKTEIEHNDAVYPNVKEIVYDLMEKVEDNFNNIDGEPQVYDSKFNMIISLLKQGKKLAVKDLQYSDRAVPTIKIKDIDGDTDVFDLDCLATNGFDSYIVEEPLGQPDEVSIISYNAPHTTKIEYLYANSQMNCLMAHLEDGREVDYKLSILDVFHVTGEYLPEPTQVIHLTFFQQASRWNRAVDAKVVEYPKRMPIKEIINRLIKAETTHPEMDMMVYFSDLDDKPIRYVTAEQRKVTGDE